MNAEFNWWLLIVGVAAGAGLAWLTLSDWGRRDEDLEQDERAAEAAWIADVLRERGDSIDAIEAEEVLALHREYLRQAGLYDPGVQELGAEAAGIDGAEWEDDQWTSELSNGEASAQAAPVEPSPDHRTGEPDPGGAESVTPAARQSIRSGGAVAPRATPETRQIGSEPPQP